MITRLFSATILAVVAAGLVAGSGWQPLRAEAQKKKFESIEAILASHNITAETPGVAMCVTSAKEAPRIVTAGLADLKEKRELKPGTLFEIASCSKPFTATAILLLHDKGLLDVNDPVRKYIPELPDFFPKQPLLISHLLHHTGGLADYLEFDDPPAKHGKFWVNEDYVPEFAKQKGKHAPLFAPGARYEYSNTGYMLLSVIVTRVSKQSFGEFQRDHIFVPLKMAHTFVLDNPEGPKLAKDFAPKAVAYSMNKKTQNWYESWGCPPRLFKKNMVIGDGGVWTSLDDLQKWDTAVRNRELLKPGTWEKALTPSKTRDGKTNDYGFGWGLEWDSSKKITGFGHSGSWAGFESDYWHDLSKKRSTIVLSNRENFATERFITQVHAFLDRK